jgi:predicted NBD/HSP70 family sugar kinase
MERMVQKRGPAARSGDGVSGVPASKVQVRTPWPALSSPQRQVVASIRQRGACSREQLGTELVWSPSAVSKVVSPLLASEALVSTPPGVRRRNAQLSPSPDLGLAIGIELGFAKVRAAVVDFNGHIVGQKRDYRPDRLSPDAFFACVQKVIRELLLRPLPAPILGIGIGYADRAAWNPAQPFASDRAQKNAVSWSASIEETFSLPVQARCDAACAALGEHRSGQLRGVENGLYLLYEDGIGLGIIASNHVVFGAVNDAGEIGHMPIAEEGEYCHCGNIGCLETIAAKWALNQKAKWIFEKGGQVNFRRSVTDRAPQFDELCAMAMSGDILARNMLVKAGRAVGRALAISASLFDPSVVVLGGCLSSPDGYTPLVAAMKEEFQTLSAHRTPQPIRFEPSALGEDAALIGAAELVFAQVVG